jgi:hypothetical protein
MSDYTRTQNFTAKDSLATGDAEKVITGADVDGEFNAIATAIGTKEDTGLIPSGTVMLFVQTAAPTGFTKVTTHNDKSLRVVSGSVGTGGSVAFTTAFASNRTATGTTGGTAVSVSGTVGSHTLSTGELPAHNHSLSIGQFVGSDDGQSNGSGRIIMANRNYASGGGAADVTIGNTGGAGGHTHPVGSLAGASHTHSFTSGNMAFDVNYVDVIIATKD